MKFSLNTNKLSLGIYNKFVYKIKSNSSFQSYFLFTYFVLLLLIVP